jgi:hypothetical protein
MSGALAIVGLAWLAFNIVFAVLTIGPSVMQSIRRKKAKQGLWSVCGDGGP